jgi:hypothetical protein
MLRKQLADFKDGLIPFEIDEYKIASSTPIVKKRRKGKSTILKGFLSTIYQEPIMAFAMKNRMQKGHFVLICESDKDEFIFVCTKKGTTVKHNGKDLGVINSEGSMLDLNGKLIGELDLASARTYQKIVVHNKEVAHMNVYESDSSNESDRMFSLFHDFSVEDEEEMIALSLYNLLIRPRL